MSYATAMAEAKAEYDHWAGGRIPERVHRTKVRVPRKAACSAGHPLSGENLSPSGRCRACQKGYTARWHIRTKSATL